MGIRISGVGVEAVDEAAFEVLGFVSSSTILNSSPLRDERVDFDLDDRSKTNIMDEKVFCCPFCVNCRPQIVAFDIKKKKRYYVQLYEKLLTLYFVIFHYYIYLFF
ncbi:hypothetical protein DsansV1_C26g0189961 [Dioscorea sansibarensis]